jgi:hypothetical protein
MFADPTITVNSVAQALKRVGLTSNNGKFRTADGLFELKIGQSAGKNFQQSSIRLDRWQTVADPFITGNNLLANDAIWVVRRSPAPGLITVATQKQLWDGLSTYLNASSGAAFTQLLGGEI